MTEQTDQDAAARRALEQARLRKERREAKIKAGGAARLNRITSAGGGISRGKFRSPPTGPLLQSLLPSKPLTRLFACSLLPQNTSPLLPLEGMDTRCP